MYVYFVLLHTALVTDRILFISYPLTANFQTWMDFVDHGFKHTLNWKSLSFLFSFLFCVSSLVRIQFNLLKDILETIIKKYKLLLSSVLNNRVYFHQMFWMKIGEFHKANNWIFYELLAAWHIDILLDDCFFLTSIKCIQCEGNFFLE